MDLDRVSPRFRRRGASVTEVAVVVVCLGLILALLIPYIASTRAVSREAQSRRNLERLTAAAIRLAEIEDDGLPLLVDGDGTSWPGQLLPHLAPAGSEAAAEPEAAAWQPVFAAPGDPRASGTPQGILSYAADGGYGRFEFVASESAVREVGLHTAGIDLDGDGEVGERERRINSSTGVVWRPGDDEFRVTMGLIRAGDGLETTLLLAENFHAGTWLSTETMDLAFVIGRGRLTFEGGPAGPTPLRIEEFEPGPFAPGANPGAPRGRAPRPFAGAGRPVNVAFCDGRVRPMAIEIDPLVYAQLLTPNGSEFGEIASGPPQ